MTETNPCLLEMHAAVHLCWKQQLHSCLVTQMDITMAVLVTQVPLSKSFCCKELEITIGCSAAIGNVQLYTPR